MSRRLSQGGVDNKGVPKFTFTGSYTIRDDSYNVISPSNYRKVTNWNIFFTSSGTLTIDKLKGLKDSPTIDVFVVGGGGKGGDAYSVTVQDTAYITQQFGAGGGGGYAGKSTSGSNISITANNAYTITVGGSGASSSAFGKTAQGGASGANASNYANAGGTATKGGNYQSVNGSNATAATTRPFSKSAFPLCCGNGAGGGGVYYEKSNGTSTFNQGSDGASSGAVYGCGGAGGLAQRGYAGAGASGSSGVVVIRNHR